MSSIPTVAIFPHCSNENIISSQSLTDQLVGFISSDLFITHCIVCIDRWLEPPFFLLASLPSSLLGASSGLPNVTLPRVMLKKKNPHHTDSFFPSCCHNSQSLSAQTIITHSACHILGVMTLSPPTHICNTREHCL